MVKLDAPSVCHALHRSLMEPGHHARIALSGAHGNLTRESLLAAISSISAQLRDAGVPYQTIIGVLASGKSAAACGLLGAMQAGAIPWVIDAKIGQDELEARLRALEVRWLIADASMAASVRRLAARVPVAVIELSPGSAQDRYMNHRLQPDDAALLLLTSGSTGTPKGVVLSHRNLLANAFGISAHTRLTASDHLLHVMPIHHTNGINNQLIAPLLAGASVALVDRFSVSRLVEQIQVQRPTYVTGVPTMFMRLLTQPVSARALRSLRFARCGSAPITDEQHRSVEEHLGVPLIVSYGLSEATCTSVMNPVSARRIGSVGTVLAGQQVVVVNPGTAAEVPTGSEGEICIGGACVMHRYLGVRTPSSLDIGENGRLRTGDLGRFDDDGYLYVTGRIKDVIIRGGENIAPQSIESALRLHPDVAACAVVGAPDDDLGEVPVAFVVARSESKIDQADLQRHAVALLNPRFVPSRIVQIETLPETPLGKIDRKQLRATAARSHDLGEPAALFRQCPTSDRPR